MDPNATYRAIVCRALGPPDELKVEHLPRAGLSVGHVRVKLVAAGLNFPDLLMVQGLYQYRPELPFVPGMEAAGVISDVAPDVTSFSPEQKVMVRMRTGAFAEEVIVSAAQILPLPSTFTFEHGATFLAAHTTAFHALKTRAKIKGGQTLLVLGAAGGVGLAAVQIGKMFCARVIAAASTERKLALAQQMGADEILNYANCRIEDEVRRLTGGRGVEIMFDPVGLAQENALRCLTWDGKLLVVGFAGGQIHPMRATAFCLKARRSSASAPAKLAGMIRRCVRASTQNYACSPSKAAFGHTCRNPIPSSNARRRCAASPIDRRSAESR